MTSESIEARRCIRIVEDSRTQAEALRAFLEESGFSTSVASSGEKALEALRVHPADLVISDILMPTTMSPNRTMRRSFSGESVERSNGAPVRAQRRRQVRSRSRFSAACSPLRQNASKSSTC